MPVKLIFNVYTIKYNRYWQRQSLNNLKIKLEKMFCNVLGWVVIICQSCLCTAKLAAFGA